MCILIRSRIGLGILTRALEAAGVPYRLEGHSLVFGTQEVQDLLNCLRAIDNPADQVSVVAALRSPALACSDVNLARWRDSRRNLELPVEPAGRRYSWSMRIGRNGAKERSSWERIFRFVPAC